MRDIYVKVNNYGFVTVPEIKQADERTVTLQMFSYPGSKYLSVKVARCVPSYKAESMHRSLLRLAMRIEEKYRDSAAGLSYVSIDERLADARCDLFRPGPREKQRVQKRSVYWRHGHQWEMEVYGHRWGGMRD